MSPRLIPLRIMRGLGLCCAILLWNSMGWAQEWSKPAWVIEQSQLDAVRRQLNTTDTPNLQSSSPSAPSLTRICDYYLSMILTFDDRAREVDRFLSVLNRAQNTVPARYQILDILATRIPALLNHPDPNVRYNALSMLAQSSVKPSIPGSPQKAVPYNSGQRIFIPVVVDQAQNLDARIVSVRGLERILRDGENAPSSNEKSDIAEALIKALKDNPPNKDDGRIWFRGSLLHALGFVDRIDNVAGQPVILEALLAALQDVEDTMSNRAQAAKSLTQLPWSAQTNAPLITHEICRLLLQTAEAYQRGPVATRDDASRLAFGLIYLSYMPEGKPEAAKNWGLLFQINRAGLNSHGDFVKASHKVVMPVVRPFLEAGPKLAAGDVETLRKWVNENKPQDRRVTPSAAPLP